MNYKELNDNELIYLCCDNNEYAEKLIIEKYRPCILNILKQYMKEYNVLGMEIADLYQEGLIGLMHAIKGYNEKKDASFSTYASACIKSNIMNSVRHSFRKKTRILNNSYSLDKLVDDTNSSFYDFFEDKKADPNMIILSTDEENNIIEELKHKLSKTELIVFNLKLKSINNDEIADLINKDKKYVENTIFRIGKKYREIINK